MKQRYALVYQAGIANVLKVDTFNLLPQFRISERVLQGSFSECEAFCNGLKLAGMRVKTFACNKAGDIADQVWSTNLEEQPFSDKFKPVFTSQHTA
jgi:hypothetical protein